MGKRGKDAMGKYTKEMKKERRSNWFAVVAEPGRERCEGKGFFVSEFECDEKGTRHIGSYRRESHTNFPMRKNDGERSRP